MIKLGSFKLRASQQERGTVRLACGASGHPARCVPERASEHLSADCGQDARRPHRLEALCHDSPARHVNPFSGPEMNHAP